MRVGYLRMSPLVNNELEKIEKFRQESDVSRVFWDKVSIKSDVAETEEYSRMMRYLQKGDVLIIPEFAGLGKNIIELFQMISQLNQKGIRLESRREKFDSESDDGKILLESLNKIADFENRVLLQRRREGIAKAKAEGKYKGGGRLKEKPEDFGKYAQMYRLKQMTVVDIAKHFKVSRVTVYKWIKQVNQEVCNNDFCEKLPKTL